MDQLHYKSAVQLASLIRRKKIGCLELLDHFLGRIEKYNPKLNAIIWLDKDRARKRARAADAALKKGKRFGPLHGVPMSIKEGYQVAGSPTTWGAPSMKANVTAETAVSAQRMIDAGVTLFAKTNVPLMLADWQSYNAVYGVTRNPWDLDRTPGGSSGGSAVALSAGLTGIDAGSDIGSSIRNPAHYCGVFGHKPTYGLITYRGHALPNSVAPPDISVVGPLARSAEDLDVALDIMAGHDPDDGGYLKVALPKCEKKTLKQFRVAVKLTDPASDVDIEYADQLQALVDKLAKAGCKVKEAAPAIDTARLHDLYIRLLRAATSARMPESDIEDWTQELAAEPNEYLAQSVDGVTMTHRRWLQLDNERHADAIGVQRLFRGLRHPALSGRRIGGLPARPRARRQALAPPHHRQQQAGVPDRSVVLGRLFGSRVFAVHGRAGRHHAVGAADRLSGRRAPRPRQDIDRVRQAGRESLRRLRAAEGVLT